MTKDQILSKIATIQENIDALKAMVIDLPDDASTNAEPLHNETSVNSSNPTTPEELIEHFLYAASSLDESMREGILTKILHSSLLKHNPALDSFMRFGFKTLQGRWEDYLKTPADYSSFVITRQQRNDRGELSDLKVYLEAANRSPCPITFQQDPDAEMQWKIISSSL